MSPSLARADGMGEVYSGLRRSELGEERVALMIWSYHLADLVGLYKEFLLIISLPYKK